MNAPPVDRSPLWGRIGALAVMALIFWADAMTPMGVASCQSGSTEAIEVSLAESEGLCVLEVVDRGTGFGGQDPERLFEAFYTTKKSGTGLGLAIVRRLVSLQCGQIALLGREGGGAIARLTLPAAQI